MITNARSLHLWVGATRPKTLWAAVAPVLIGLSLCYGEGFFNPVTALFTILCALLIQIGTNFANDYHDGIKGSDRSSDRLGPVRLTRSGLINPVVMRNFFIYNGIFIR